jgi:hypothetical protein
MKRSRLHHLGKPPRMKRVPQGNGAPAHDHPREHEEIPDPGEAHGDRLAANPVSPGRRVGR